MDVATISGALTSLRAVMDISKGMLNLHNVAEVQGKVIELQAAILDAQGKVQDARDDVDTLKRKLDDALSDLAALQSHKTFVVTLSRAGGAYLAPNDPDPFCPCCIEVSTKAIHLIKTSRLELGKWVWQCPSCKTAMQWRKPQPE
jgi:hypothetical protein